jgi:hypothetical protein
MNIVIFGPKKPKTALNYLFLNDHFKIHDLDLKLLKSDRFGQIDSQTQFL